MRPQTDQVLISVSEFNLWKFQLSEHEENFFFKNVKEFKAWDKIGSQNITTTTPVSNFPNPIGRQPLGEMEKVWNLWWSLVNNDDNGDDDDVVELESATQRKHFPKGKLISVGR